jgi:Tfp pilus assembly protein PilE
MRLARVQSGFTLDDLLVLITIIMILVAICYPIAKIAYDSALTTGIKSRGRAVWLSIVSANFEREATNQSAVWPYELRLPVDQGGAGYTFTTATEYFKILMEGASPENQIAFYLKPEMLSARGFPAASNADTLTANNIAWRVAEVSDKFSNYDAFMISKDIAPVARSGLSNDVVNLSRTGPFKGKRVVWVTRNGGMYDAKPKHMKTWGDFFPSTNNVPFLAD